MGRRCGRFSEVSREGQVGYSALLGNGKEKLKLSVPNPHRGMIGKNLLAIILREAGFRFPWIPLETQFSSSAPGFICLIHSAINCVAWISRTLLLNGGIRPLPSTIMR